MRKLRLQCYTNNLYIKHNSQLRVLLERYILFVFVCFDFSIFCFNSL